MPLAVFRVPLPSRWPYEFTLTDDMAMAPGMNLSAFPNALVEARISRSGMATPQSGDITGTPMPAQSGKAASPEGSITLVLDRVVP
jgi:cytochrome c-type biogenesis protein CcmH